MQNTHVYTHTVQVVSISTAVNHWERVLESIENNTIESISGIVKMSSRHHRHRPLSVVVVTDPHRHRRYVCSVAIRY